MRQNGNSSARPQAFAWASLSRIMVCDWILLTPFSVFASIKSPYIAKRTYLVRSRVAFSCTYFTIWPVLVLLCGL